jgi:DNA polymerase III epsilon subunit-like protein
VDQARADQLPLAVVDVEGNGQRPPDIVELAVVPIDGGRVGSFRSWLVRPPRAITAMVTERVHGITNEDVADAPEWAEVAHEVAGALEGRILVAHNAGVERKLLERYLPDYHPPQVIDTLVLARKQWPTLHGYGLSDLIEARGIRMTSRYGRRHRAGYDAYATAQLYLQLAEAAGDPAEPRSLW